jgi:hypothetical protein
MAIVKGVSETGEAAFYDVPDGDLAQYKLDAKPLSGEKPSKAKAQAVIPLGQAPAAGDVEGFAAWCEYLLYDDYGNWVYWQDYC